MNSLPQACASLVPGLVPVPASPREGVCKVCHGACPPHYSQCYRCHAVVDTGIEVLPISISVHDGLLHTHLRQYKDSESLEVRTKATNALAALTAAFFGQHRECIGAFDLVTTIPSPTRDSAAAIVESILNIEPFLKSTLVAKRSGDRDIDSARFEVVSDVRGQRILLFDDTLTSGGTIFSAANALVGSGAHVTTAVVIGRHFRPNFEASGQLWKWLKDRTWDLSRCARCNGEMRDHFSLF